MFERISFSFYKSTKALHLYVVLVIFTFVLDLIAIWNLCSISFIELRIVLNS